MKNFNGFNIVKNYSIWPHYRKSEKQLINNWVNKHKASLIAIDEKSAVVLENKKLSLIGDSVFIFNKQGTTKLKSNI